MLENEESRIPPSTFWNLKHLRETGVYFWLKSIQAYLPNGHVMVDGYGSMIMMSGYSYLGLNGDSRIQEAAKAAIDQFGTGTQGSRLLAGTLDLHEELEREIASFKGTDSAVLFSTGFVTNSTAIACLLRPNDYLISDKYNHASLIDGCQHSQAQHVRFTHNNMESLRLRLQRAPENVRKLVVIDGVYSMDGDIARLPEISFLCRQYGAYLMVDECHAVGVLGERGTGLEEHFGLPLNTIDIKMGTLSKSIPSSGGYIAGSADLCDFLKHEARGFIYSGSLSAPVVAASLAALRIIKSEPERVANLRRNTEYFTNMLRSLGFDLGPTESPIVPIVVGEDQKAALLARYCQEHGVFIHAVLPPVVPVGTARLRASISAMHSKQDLDFVAETLYEGAIELGILDSMPLALTA